MDVYTFKILILPSPVNNNSDAFNDMLNEPS